MIFLRIFFSFSLLNNFTLYIHRLFLMFFYYFRQPRKSTLLPRNFLSETPREWLYQVLLQSSVLSPTHSL